MPKLSDMKLGGKIVALITSPNGYGKSNVAASFAAAGKTKFYDFDGRMQAVRFFSGMELNKPYLDNIEYETFNHKNFEQFKKQIEDLQTRNPYKCIVIDSFTNFSTTCITYQMNLKGQGGGKITKGGLAVTTWDEINGETMLAAQLMDILKTLRCHVIMTAHPVKKTLVGTTTERYDSIASYGNKVPSLIPTYFNEQWIIDLESSPSAKVGMQRFLYTQPTPKFDAKTALPLPDKIDITGEPDVHSMIQKLLAEKDMELNPDKEEVINA